MNVLIRRSLSLNTNSKILHQDIDIDETAFSVFRGEEVSINKILSRDSSFGQSSRINYTSTNNLGVPFQWEKKPGTPINPPREEVLQPTPPPPPPSPAMQSLVLPRPMVERKGFSLSWRFWSWRKRLRRILRLQMYDGRRYLIKFRSNAKGNKIINSSDGDLDTEFVGWIHSDSKSSSSSTISSSVGLSSEHFESFREGVPFCCTTWRKHKKNNK